jgi:RimJ/RimL family protein N-acetyltransferase
MHRSPILFDFPESFETQRLILRAPMVGDGKALNEAVCESIEELRLWMPWAKDVPTQEDSEENVRAARLKFLERSDLRLHLIDKQTGQLIGCSGWHRIDWEARKFEIGYWLRTSVWGKGLMTEAVQGITNFAIETLEANRLEIRCDAKNTRSAAVAKRLGYTLEAILRKERMNTAGELSDTMVFAKVRGEEF